MKTFHQLNSFVSYLTVLATAFSFGVVNAQSPDWLWAKSATGSSSEYISATTTDGDGNIICVGDFNSNNLTIGTTTLTNVSSLNLPDGFIAKYDSSGNVLWAISVGGSSTERLTDVACDSAGNIIVVGAFSSSNLTIGSATLTNAGAPGTSEAFIAKYDPSGNFMWASSANGNSSNDDQFNSVTVDLSGNILTAGFFQSPSIDIDTTTLTIFNTGGQDMFIVKYNAAGSVLWARSAGGNSFVNANTVVSDTAGNVIIAGGFEASTLTFGSTTLFNSSIGYNDMYVVKYDAFGNVIWAASAGGNSDDVASFGAVDSTGNIVIAGYFGSSTITFGTTLLTNSGALYEDVFIVKYDAMGNVLWANSIGGNFIEVPASVASDAAENVVVSLHYNSSTLTIGSSTFINAGSFDVIIAKYDPAGNVLWTKSIGGPNSEEATVTSDAFGSLIVAGSFASPTLVFGTTTLTNSGFIDLFLAKLGGTASTGFYIHENISDDIIISPNLASDHITIISEKRFKRAELMIIDFLGHIIYRTITGESERLELDVSKFVEGIYFIQIQSSDFIAQRKFVIAR